MNGPSEIYNLQSQIQNQPIDNTNYSCEFYETNALQHQNSHLIQNRDFQVNSPQYYTLSHKMPPVVQENQPFSNNYMQYDQNEQNDNPLVSFFTKENSPAIYLNGDQHFNQGNLQVVYLLYMITESFIFS